MHRWPLLGAAATLVLASGAAAAQANSLAAKVGAFGLGLEYGYSFGNRFALKAGVNGGDLGFDAVESGIAYDFDLGWDSLSLAADFHPWGGAFHLSAGFLRNQNSLEATSRAAANIVLGGTEYTPAEVGTLNARAFFDATAPFLGLGWDWSSSDRLLGMTFDLGVLDEGSPHVLLKAHGGLASGPAFRDDLAEEQVELTSDLESYDLIPYASLGVVFRF